VHSSDTPRTEANPAGTAVAVDACDQARFREVIGRFTSGVTLITTTAGGKRYGMTASAVSSLSLEPPMLLICVNRAAPTCAAISSSGIFGVNILSENQGDLADRFAQPSKDKFAGVPVEDGALGIPLLEAALARLECRVTEEVAGGTHTVFLAHVVTAEAGAGLPLTYFRGRLGRLELQEDEAVYDEIRRQILQGEFADAQQLDVAELARKLAVEPWHVYHALTRLVADDLVARDPMRGYVIAPVSLVAVEDALDGRRAIEIGAVELSIGRATGAEIAELRRLMEATVPLVEAGHFADVNAYATANARFHEHMVGLARSEALLHAYRRLGLTGILARSLSGSNEASPDLAEDHRQLVEAYERQDLEAAKRMIDQHTERAKLTHRRAFESN
jgi:flavin reductase (DIM6/NTAB) family NADH-FMN oxidoreductase RutF/DNA-binding FadR family transcriptional regulator